MQIYPRKQASQQVCVILPRLGPWNPIAEPYMTWSRLEKIRKKASKRKEKALDSLKATLARWQNLVTLHALALPEAARRKPRMVLLAHYSAQNTVHPYVLRFIQVLQEADCDVMLISTSDTLAANEVSRLNAQGVSVIVRRNIGYDFGSWRTAIDVYPDMTRHYPSIIFANDSVYGPLFDLAPVLAAVDDSVFDVWALTSSNERGRHLQTYFWGMSRNSVSSGFFDYFWHDYYRFYSRRQTVIDRYELQIATIAEQRFGLKAGACWDESTLISRYLDSRQPRPKHLNPLRDFWRELLVNHGFPFVKRELFKAIDLHGPLFADIADVAAGIDAEVWALCNDHLLAQAVDVPTASQALPPQ